MLPLTRPSLMYINLSLFLRKSSQDWYITPHSFSTSSLSNWKMQYYFKNEDWSIEWRREGKILHRKRTNLYERHLCWISDFDGLSRLGCQGTIYRHEIPQLHWRLHWRLECLHIMTTVTARSIFCNAKNKFSHTWLDYSYRNIHTYHRFAFVLFHKLTFFGKISSSAKKTGCPKPEARSVSWVEDPKGACSNTG